MVSRYSILKAIRSYPKGAEFTAEDIKAKLNDDTIRLCALGQQISRYDGTIILKVRRNHSNHVRQWVYKVI